MKVKILTLVLLFTFIWMGQAIAQSATSEGILLPEDSFVVAADNTRVEINHHQYLQISEELEKSAEGKPKKERKLLKKISAKMKAFAKSNFVKKTGRALGKGSTAIAVESTRPFVQAISFLRGFFEKESKSRDYEKVLFFFLENEQEIASVYEEATTFEDLQERLEEKITEIIETKMMALFKGFLRDFNIDLGVIESITTIEGLEEYLLGQNNLQILMAIGSENAKEVFDKNVKEQKLDIYLSGLTEDQINEFIMGGASDLSILIDFEKLIDEEKRNLFIESSTALISQMILPATVIGAVSSAMSTVVGSTLLIADIGAAISVSVCSGEKTQMKLDSDSELAKFCSYVLYKSSHKILKSKAKGFLAGKSLKRNFLGHIAHLKDRKAKIEECVSEGESRKECRKKVKKQKQLEIIDCVNDKLSEQSQDSVGKLRRKCRQERREALRLK